jgi:dephospho-CoA kinase
MSSYCVAITGGIGVGKSTAASFFKEFGAKIISADQISKDLTNKLVVKNQLKELFGNQIFDEQFNLKRKTLANLIFNDFKKKQALENLLHPLIRQQITNEIATSTKDYCLIEIPLLTSLEDYPYINRVLCIIAKPADQLKFTTLRDKASHKEIKNIISQQITDKDRLALSNDVIKNISSIDNLKQNCLKLHLKYINQSQKGAHLLD